MEDSPDKGLQLGSERGAAEPTGEWSDMMADAGSLGRSVAEDGRKNNFPEFLSGKIAHPCGASSAIDQPAGLE
jgi:hypothetical protein